MDSVKLQRNISTKVNGNVKKSILRRTLSVDSPGEQNWAANRGSMTAVEELVQCGLCYERLNNPRMLPCQHTFCLYCLQSHTLASSTSHEEVMQESLGLDKMRDLLKNIKQVPCPTCLKEVQTHVDCLQYLENLPSNLYINSLLKVLDSANGQTQNSNRKCVSCENDFDDAKNFCEHCKQNFCGECWTSHAEYLQTKFPDFVNNLKDFNMCLTKCNESFRDTITTVANKIKESTEQKIHEIRDLENYNLQEVEKIQAEQSEKSKKLRDMIENVVAKSVDYKTKQLTENEKTIILVHMDKEIKKIRHRLSHLADKRVSFDTKVLKLVHDKSLSANQALLADNDASPNYGVNPLEAPQNLLNHYRAHNFSPKYVWTKCARPAGVAISPWNPNHLYLAATDYRMILIMDLERMKIIGRLTSEKMIHPQAVAFGKQREEIYVVDKLAHCVHVFSKVGQQVGVIEGKFKSPEGIATGTDGQIILSDTGNDRVLVLDASDGKQLSTIGINGGRTELNMPTGLAVHDNKVIIADTGNNRIKVYTIAGKFVLEIGSLGADKGQLQSAEVVAVDPLGFILVGDGGNARIQIFKPDGTLVKIFGGKGLKAGKYEWVSGIAVSDDLKIITTDYKSHQLLVYHAL